MITLFSGCEEVSLCSELSGAGTERFPEVAEYAGAAETAMKKPEMHKSHRRKRALITDPSPPPGGEGGTSWNQSRENSLRLWLEIANGFFRAPLPSRPGLIPAIHTFLRIPRDDMPTLAIDFAKHLHLR
jgi:hypothetical protein